MVERPELILKQSLSSTQLFGDRFPVEGRQFHWSGL
jgi:hypothetical protein